MTRTAAKSAGVALSSPDYDSTMEPVAPFPWQSPTASKAGHKEASPQAPSEPRPSSRFDVVADGRTREQLVADIAVEGVLSNAGTVSTFSFGQLGESDLMQTVKALRRNIELSRDGDLVVADTLLLGQAAALNAIFNELARRAAMNIGEFPEAVEMYLRLALKAQNQCRSTLESLSKIKNPPSVAFVKQANIAHGHQQVNNGTPSGGVGEPARTEKTAGEQFGQLEQGHAQRLDTGTEGAAVDRDPILATVGKIDRADNRRRQGARVAEPLERRRETSAPDGRQGAAGSARKP